MKVSSLKCVMLKKNTCTHTHRAICENLIQFTCFNHNQESKQLLTIFLSVPAVLNLRVILISRGNAIEAGRQE